jgi:O-antigen ligase
VILFALFPFIIKRRDFSKLVKLPTLIWLSFFLLLIFQTFMLGRWFEDWVILQKILLSGGLVLLYLPVQDTKKLNQAIIFSSLAAIIYSFVRLVILMNQEVTFSFLETGSIIEALLVDRIYLGLLSVLSILASYHFLKKEYHPENRYYLANIILNVLFILFIVSRIAIFALVIIFVLSLFYRKKSGPQLLFFVGFIFLTVLLVFILNNDLRKHFFYNNNDNIKEGLLGNTMALEPRTVIWECAYQLTGKEGVMLKGEGFTATNNDMMDCYKTSIKNLKKQEWFLAQKYNVHNQFLDLYIATGLMATLLFLGGLIVLFVKNRKQFFPTALLLTMVLFMSVENVFHRQIGAYYVGFFLLVLLMAHSTGKNNEHIEEQ